MPTPEKPHLTDILVVGGGIGGLSAAYALARAGLRVSVLERAAEFGEVGAGLQLAPNCTRLLDDYGLLDEARSLGVLPTAMVMRDAVDGSELTRFDLGDLRRVYGSPYLVIHRSDLHGIFLRACRRAGVELLTGQDVVEYRDVDDGAAVVLADGEVRSARLVVAADGLRSVARARFVGDEPVSSAYVAYRAAVPLDRLGDRKVDLGEVAVYVGPGHHFVHYALRGGEMLNQVAVFRSPKALAGREEWGTPDELDAAFVGACDEVRSGIPLMWRDRWWPMYDRNPIRDWVHGRIVLLGDAAHPPLQYMAQGAVMAIEDGWVLAKHLTRALASSSTTWDDAVAAYEAVRAEHCARVVLTARRWGDLWHLDGVERQQRNALLRARDTYDYTFADWIYGPTALTPDQIPPPYPDIPLGSALY